jgi:predicted transposase/invertase (TIGR01784 family)
MERIKIINDYFIRYLFGREQNSGILRSFINAVLTDKGYPPVASVHVTNPFLGPVREIMKESILDIRAVDEHGRSYDIEIQTFRQQRYIARALYYWGKLYTSQLGKGKQYDRLRPVIQINVLDCNLFPDNRVHRNFLVIDREDPSLALSDHLQLHFIEARKFARAATVTTASAISAVGEQVSEPLRNWLTFLKEGNTETFMQYVINDEFIRQARDEYDDFVMDPAQQAAYDAHEKWLHDYATNMHHAKEEGLIEGRKEGLEEGLLRGVEQGKREGLQEALNETIRKMKAAGFPVETISQITGSTAEEIGAIF